MLQHDQRGMHMKNGEWKFWFAIMGALLTASGMFWSLKIDVAKTQIEIEHIKQDVASIKTFIEEGRHANHQAFQTR